jgi:hypothetical protein
MLVMAPSEIPAALAAALAWLVALVTAFVTAEDRADMPVPRTVAWPVTVMPGGYPL